MRAVLAGAIYFALVFAAGFGFGVVRTLVLTPRVGPVVAVLIEVPLILGVSWWACGQVLRRASLGPAAAGVMGAVAFGLLMLGETAISMLLAGRSLGEHLALYAEVQHQLGLLAQLGFAILPWVRSRQG